MNRRRALGALGAALVVLVGASLAARHLVLPVSLAIAALLGVVALSYRQTIRAYESSGGAYVVAKDNLGTLPALVAAAAEADLVVVGSRGLHGLRALGSVSERVAHTASCSALVVREPVWQRIVEELGRQEP